MSELISVFGIYLPGFYDFPTATFLYQEHAEGWAQEHYHSRGWLMKEIQIPAIPFATQEEWDKARIEGKKMHEELFGTAPQNEKE